MSFCGLQTALFQGSFFSKIRLEEYRKRHITTPLSCTETNDHRPSFLSDLLTPALWIAVAQQEQSLRREVANLETFGGAHLP